MECPLWCLFKAPSLILSWQVLAQLGGFQCQHNKWWFDSSEWSYVDRLSEVLGLLSLRHVLTLEWDNIHSPKLFIGNLSVYLGPVFYFFHWISSHLYLSIFCFFAYICLYYLLVCTLFKVWSSNLWYLTITFSSCSGDSSWF